MASRPALFGKSSAVLILAAELGGALDLQILFRCEVLNSAGWHSFHIIASEQRLMQGLIDTSATPCVILKKFGCSLLKLLATISGVGDPARARSRYQ
jgi:hypothetical protein